MKHNVVAPSVGESITEVSLLKWNKQNGEKVNTGEILVEIESDKATVEIVAEATGALQILKPEGETVPIGEIVAIIDDAAEGTQSASAPAPAASAPSPAPSPAAAASPGGPTGATAGTPLSPAVQKMVTERGIDPSQVAGTGKDGRITKGDILTSSPGGGVSPAPSAPVSAPAPTQAPKTAPAAAPAHKDGPGDRRVPMSRLRQKIAQRLVQAQHDAAILTTFNEIDMSPVMELRKQFKEGFKSRNGVSLSFMSFFTRGVIEALKEIPAVNAFIDGTDIIYHDYHDIGIAVGTDRGLVVPVIRNATNLSFVELETKMAELATKARQGKLSIADMSGGTFTISNGGTYGSLLSTPILNPPQSGILGMHAIKERPIALDGQVVVRPMMNVALSYDHRIIDGKEAVTFLVILKDHLENPEKLGLESVRG